MYGKLEKGVLVEAPVNYLLPNGGLIVNFNKNVVLMKKYGFKEVIDIKPEHDPVTQYLMISGYSETEDNIIVNYTIKELNNTDQQATIRDQIRRLESTDTDLELAITELYELVAGGAL